VHRRKLVVMWKFNNLIMMVSSYSLLSYMQSLDILMLPNVSVGVLSYFETADIEMALVLLLPKKQT